MASYAELQIASNYSFLRAASHVEELVVAALTLGIQAIAITDRNSLAGQVRAFQRAGEAGLRLVVGCQLTLADGMSLLVYPTDRAAYGRLCRLLSLGKGRAGKGGCDLGWDDLAAAGEGLIVTLLPPREEAATAACLGRLRAGFGDRAYCAITPRREPGDAVRRQRVEALAAGARVATVATGDVRYHDRRRRILLDVMACIREGRRIEDIGELRAEQADREMRGAGEMAELLPGHEAAIARTLEIVERCRFSLAELRYQYPEERHDPSLTAQQTLARLTWEGAGRRYAEGVPEDVRRQLDHELRLVEILDYAPYFLTVHAIVSESRRRGILCQGRGSAANSAICYVLGITSIDPVRSGLLFERFVSTARREPPDIDVDFEHERREEIIQWVYDHYGRDQAALCATVNRYRARGAVREVGKVMGLPEDVTAALASQVWGWSEEGVEAEHAESLGLDLADRRLRLTLSLARALIGFPRHLGQHPGGFVLTNDRLDELVPIEPAAMADRQVIEWDKDDIDVLRFMKVDVLGLGMLGCLRRCFDLLAKHRGLALDLAGIPAEDRATYAMIQRADTLGTFQIESRAQMSMLPRLKPRRFYDLVIQVAIVRPGPIQGDMVHPYLRRREGIEAVSYPTPELEAVLGKTLGVPLFQEQAMKVAIVCAGFTAEEADALRRSMATFKFTGGVSHFRDKLIAGMAARGYDRAFAERTFTQIEGFGSYGFPESHAASFALIAYASSWLKCHHPDVFCAALLNAQPMGFYAPAQVVRDAVAHGVEVRPVSADASAWDCTIEGSAVRLGLRMVKGLSEAAAARLIEARPAEGFGGVAALWRRSGLGSADLTRIAEADGFHCYGLDRRAAIWAVRGLGEAALPLFSGLDETIREAAVRLPRQPDGGEVVDDYRSTGLTLRRHPVGFLRDDLAGRRILACAALARQRDGRRCAVAGMVLVRQRPGSAKGVLFITLEDETGIANIIVWPRLFEECRRLVLSATMIAVHGQVQHESGVIHLVASRIEDLSPLLASVGGRDGAFVPRTGRGDEAKHGGAPDPRGVTKPRDIMVRDLLALRAKREGRAIKVNTRDFR